MSTFAQMLAGAGIGAAVLGYLMLLVVAGERSGDDYWGVVAALLFPPLLFVLLAEDKGRKAWALLVAGVIITIIATSLD